MTPINYYRQISGDARTHDEETIAFVEQFMEFNDLQDYRQTDMMAMFPFARRFLWISRIKLRGHIFVILVLIFAGNMNMMTVMCWCLIKCRRGR